MIRTRLLTCLLATAAAVTVMVVPASAEKIKNLARVEGVRTTTVVGRGIVLGLNGTGDGANPAVQRALRELLEAELDDDVNRLNPADLRAGNAALVWVQAELSTLDRQGSRVDVQVMSLGDASSLEGGILIPTPLRDPGADDADDVVHVVAQGPVSLGRSGATPTSGDILEGGTVRKALEGTFLGRDWFTLALDRPDWQRAGEMRDEINRAASVTPYTRGAEVAFAEGPDSIRVYYPQRVQDDDQRVRFISAVLDAKVSVSPGRAVVVIDEREQSVFVSEEVTVDPGIVVLPSGASVEIAPADPVSAIPTGPVGGQAPAVAPARRVPLRIVLQQLSVNDLIAPEEAILLVRRLHDAGQIHGEVIVR